MHRIADRASTGGGELRGVHAASGRIFKGAWPVQGARVESEGIYPGRAMEREEIAAANGRERKRRERRPPDNLQVRRIAERQTEDAYQLQKALVFCVRRFRP